MKITNTILIALLFSGECREIYNAPVHSPETGYLVVEGFINSAGITTVRLSRTVKLDKGDTIKYEYNASVTIESENGESFLLQAKDSGIYISDELYLNPNEKYRLHIKTSNNKEYVSDFTAYRTTPDIDSLTWKRDDGVTIYANAHDDNNREKYFRYEYEETWEYHSPFGSSVKFDTTYDVNGNKLLRAVWRNATRTIDTPLFKCWKTQQSTKILAGTTEKLSSDIVYFPVQHIPQGSEPLSVLYSIYVKQFAISKEDYDFLQKMKKNTEQLGTIFDAQPTELTGNIHCTSDANEIVIGYIDVSEEKNKRIFISNEEVPEWNYSTDCFRVEVENDPDSIRFKADGFIPTTARKLDIGGNIEIFWAAVPQCVDCSYENRTNIKPSFWP